MTRDLREAYSFYVIMPFNIRGHSISVYISDFHVGPTLTNRYVQLCGVLCVGGGGW